MREEITTMSPRRSGGRIGGSLLARSDGCMGDGEFGRRTGTRRYISASEQKSTVRIAIVVLLSCISCVAQVAKPLRFEAAAIRPVNTVGMNHFCGGPGSSDPGRAVYSGISLRDLVSSVHTDGHSERVSGPSWLDSKYSLNLKYGSNATMDEFMGMIGTLLAERFHLTFHRVPKDVAGYKLAVAPGGPRLTDSVPGAKVDAPFKSTNDHGFWRMTFSSSPMGLLASRLGVLLGPDRFMMGPPTVLVVDRTGLHGTYDFHFEIERPVSSSHAVDADPSVGDVSYVSGALRKQLGLKLNATKVRIDYVVVDHVERVPTDN